MTFRSRIPKIITPHGRFLRPFLKCQNRKGAIDVEDKQRVVVEFLLSKGVGEEIVKGLLKVYGSAAYCRASVFRRTSDVRRGNKEFRNKGYPGRPYRHKTDAAIRSIRQEDLNASLRTIAETPSSSPETVRTHILQIGSTLKLSVGFPRHWLVN
jgi:hypothetical protein